jgi:hypothetical protein
MHSWIHRCGQNHFWLTSAPYLHWTVGLVRLAACMDVMTKSKTAAVGTNWIPVQIFTIQYNDLFQFGGTVGLQSRHLEPSNKCVLSTDLEMIPVRNVMHAHAQNFVVNQELLLPMLKTFGQCIRSLHATRNALCFHSVHSCRALLLLPVAVQ